MHLPHLNALVNGLEPYAHPVGAVRKDKPKPAPSDSFVVESALEKPEDGARREPQQQASPIEEIFDLVGAPPTSAPDGDVPQPEDALDGQDLCAFLEAAACR